MERINYIVRKDLEPFVNCVMVREETTSGITDIPLHADGYPGIMFQQSALGFHLFPKGKKLSRLFLYGQTLEPVSLRVEGPFRFVILQLYPFASRYLLNVDPRALNDDCFDLLSINNDAIDKFGKTLNDHLPLEERIEAISDIMISLLQNKKPVFDDRVQLAFHRILDKKGIVIIKDLLDEIHMTERTLERSFISETGLTPKQFAKIVQFQFSLHKLTQEKYDRLTEVGIDSGFSDQSHFTREFKRYTGQTPSDYLQQIRTLQSF